MASSSVLAKMAVLISAQTADFNKALQQSSAQMKTFGTAAQNINRTLMSFGVGFGIFEVANVIKNAVGVMMDFERTMSTVKAITGASETEFKALSKSALDLGASTRYTAKQVAELQVEYGRLGFTTKEILAATSATLDLATATGEDLAKSADVAGSTIRGFGLQASESRRVVDVMAEAFNKSALSLDNFSEAMKYVAPIAAANNISLEETTAMLGVLADSGIRGSMAGTSLRKVISDLKGESGTLAERLQKLADKGLSSADAMDEVGRTAYASLLILAKNTEKTRDLTQELNYSAGAGKEAANIMENNLAGSITKLTSAYDGLILSAGKSSGIIKETVDNLTALLTGLKNSTGALSDFTSGWLKLALAVPRGILALSRVFSGSNEANAATKEQEAKLALIESNVKAAFANGREYVLAYIDSLGNVPHKVEIISAIIQKFGETQDEVSKKVEDGLGAEKKKREEVKTGINQYRDALQKANVEYDKQTDPAKLRVIAQEIFYLEEMIKRLDRIKDLRAIDLSITVDTEALTQTTQAIDDAFARVSERMRTFRAETGQTVADVKEKIEVELGPAIAGAMATIAEGLGQAASGVGNFGQTIIKALAGFLRQIGEALISLGVGMLAAKIAIKNPVTAIAAGVAMVALSAAMASTAAKSQGSFNSGGGSGTAISQSASSNYSPATSGAQDSSPSVQFVIRGQDLWGTLKNFENNNKFLKPVNG